MKHKVINITGLFTVILAFAIGIYSCKTEPTDLGLNFIDPDDTTATFVLDSQNDTMKIANTNFKKFINTFGSDYIMIGKYNNYETRSFVEFFNIPSEYDSATVLSASVVMKYSKYAFQDSNGTVGFNFYKLNKNFTLGSITWDSVSSTDIDNVSMADYTGNPTDTSSINIPLNNTLIRDWLEYAADTNYSVKNNGLAILPNNSSTTIKGFNSSFVNNFPFMIRTTVLKNGDTTTLEFTQSNSVWFCNAPTSVLSPDMITLQNGVAFKDLMTFDLSKLPSNVIINEATVTLTLNESVSFISTNPDKRLRITMAGDTINYRDTLSPILSIQPNGNTYTFTVNGFFQFWNNLAYPNLGLFITSVNEPANLDRFVFYGSNFPDQTKVPRLKIRYTPRIPQ
ncbi:MAG TPA: hypothetical protein PLG90_00720 [Ignavibacteria bacterium]|nr:hypothetical protein [Ignavibacteria bacterium]